MNTYQSTYDSPMGKLYLQASTRGLRAISLRPNPTLPAVKLKSDAQIRKIITLAERELDLYFQGQLKNFRTPLDLHGTDFQKKVWNALREIPYGKVCSYQDIARKIRKPKAFRAVGTANGKNPLCIFIPCHRVITAQGKLGGYSGGLLMKTQLLRIEGHHHFSVSN